MSKSSALQENPNSIVDEAIPLPKITCEEHGDFNPVGTAIFLKRRECEFEDEHDVGLELRDYVMFAHQVGGHPKQLWQIQASFYAPRRSNISIHVDVRSRTWQIISARPLAVK